MSSAETKKKKISGDALNRYILIVMLVGELIVFSLVSPYFFTLKNILSLFLNVSILGIVAIGQTLCILTSDFDLSVGNAAAFTGIMMAVFFQNMNLPYIVSFILAILVAVLIGLVNGFLITKVHINAFITTMATNFMLGGLVLLVSNGTAILVSASSKSFGVLGKTTLTGLKIPLPVLILIILYVIFAWVLKNTVFGRHLYCVGGNAEAAKIAGVNIDRVKILAYILSAVLSGFAGIILASRMNAAQLTVGSTYSMESIAGTVLGGTILAGGKGKVLGTLVGVLITGILSNGLTMIGASQAWRDIATGALLIFAIIMQNMTSKIKD